FQSFQNLGTGAPGAANGAQGFPADSAGTGALLAMAAENADSLLFYRKLSASSWARGHLQVRPSGGPPRERLGDTPPALTGLGWLETAPLPLEAEFAQARVIVGTQRPMILALALLDRRVIDAGD